jgi:hypothetical protein
MEEEEIVESPCIRECRVDQVTGFCAGCFRTLKEISYWASYSREQRERIMTFLAARRAADASRLPEN